MCLMIYVNEIYIKLILDILIIKRNMHVYVFN